MNIRLAEESDLPELSTLYRQTVLVNAPQYYLPAQTEVWASFASDLNHFRSFIFGVDTYVAVDETSLLGFAGISHEGHVSSTYVRHDCIHQGIGSALMQTVLEHARTHQIPRLYAEASEFSLGLFKKFGFQVYDTERVDRQGVKFDRYLMERHLTPKSAN
ncbi:MAG: GNAT family N-acetyltransferase [Elainellaceae cyanobacterium]